MLVEVLECQHCGTMNSAARCSQCERGFVITTCHLAGLLRNETAQATADPNTEAPSICDFCSFKAAGRPATENVGAGLRQRICLSCRTEFLSGHGYPLGSNNQNIQKLHKENKRLNEELKVLVEEFRVANEGLED